MAHAERRTGMGGSRFPGHDGATARAGVRASPSGLPAGGRCRVRGPVRGTKHREQNATNAGDRDEDRRNFKGWTIAHLVRDEGVAGSNPATPTNTYLKIQHSPA